MLERRSPLHQGMALHMSDASTAGLRVLAVLAEKEALTWPGVYYVRTWLNEGVLNVGDSIMYVLIGADGEVKKTYLGRLKFDQLRADLDKL